MAKKCVTFKKDKHGRKLPKRKWRRVCFTKR